MSLFDNAPFDVDPIPIVVKPTESTTINGAATTSSAFPIDVFPQDICESFLEMSHYHNIPIDYLGITALFSVGALAGGVFKADMGNSSIKPILYACIVGPSGVGKTPAYKLLCENIIAPLKKDQNVSYKRQLQEWTERREAAKSVKQPFTEVQPAKKVRMITDATLEAITKYAELCPAGFGVVYDEGGRFFTGANAYKKDTSSVDFWNELWNGSGYEILRVDSERDRHIHSSATSVLIGMQKDRLLKYFNEDTIASGLLNRFLLCDSDYITLNEQVDHFAPAMQVAPSWIMLVQYLFNKGVQHLEGNEIHVPFEEIAQYHYNTISSGMLKEANKSRAIAMKDDSSRLMIAYTSKLAAYLPRLALVLSIIRNPKTPLITHEDVTNAKRLYDYFYATASKMLITINDSASSGLTQDQQRLFDALPNNQFITADAEMLCKELNLSNKFFTTAFNRVFSKGWIKRISKGVYEKC